MASPRPCPSSRARQALAATLAPLAALAGLAVIGGAAAPAGAATGGSISLVAYSTPKPAYAALIKAFQATKAGAGRDLLPVLRCLGLAGHRGGRRASRPTWSTSP